jgi:hypothetical protein
VKKLKWTEEQNARLKELCSEGKTNAEIADILHCTLTQVHNKRSQLGITIAKCKGIAPNPEFEKALAPNVPKGMHWKMKNAFKKLNNTLLLTMASDWTSIEDAREYEKLGDELDSLEDKYNALIGK